MIYGLGMSREKVVVFLKVGLLYQKRLRKTTKILNIAGLRARFEFRS
jgi:hypothetical protein